MRTVEARRLQRRCLRHARIYGHKPVLISHHGALALYGCMDCEKTMEVWDSPAIANGPMDQSLCEISPKFLRRILIRLISI